MHKMKILVTGSEGFVAKNLITSLKEKQEYDLSFFNRSNTLNKLDELILKSDLIIHLAGENRPKSNEDFMKVNYGLTKEICTFAKKTKRKIPIIFFSSIQAELDNSYGLSKKKAEDEINLYSSHNKVDCFIYRPPGIFGKWSKPNYNSVVSTFCYNIANDLDISIRDKNAIVKLVYIDDVIKCINEDINYIKNLISNKTSKGILHKKNISPEYDISLDDLAKKIKSYKNSRNTLVIDRVGKGLDRCLYSTYLSYLPKNKFSYKVVSHNDQRGSFVEMLKTTDSGQFSFFTAFPGVTRGGHYHHTKTEKFLILQGCARYRFRNILNDEFYEIITNEDENMVVETIPGWSHDITNIGQENLIVMLWANENFDPSRPDTINSEV